MVAHQGMCASRRKIPRLMSSKTLLTLLAGLSHFIGLESVVLPFNEKERTEFRRETPDSNPPSALTDGKYFPTTLLLSQ